MKAMRSHEYGGPEVLNLEDTDTPEINDQQLLITVKAAGVNPVDTYIRSGTNNYSATFPHTPGMDGAGEVVAVGSAVQGFKTGDRVYFSRTLTGSSAEFTVTDPAVTFPLPDSVTFTDAACLGIPAVTAHRALFGRAHAQAGETVLIHGGTGAVGTIAVQLAKAAGLTVVATAGTPDGEKLLKALGADTVLNHRSADYLQPYQTLDTGFDLIVEMLADVNLDQDLKALARHGRVIVIGSRGKIEITPRDLMARDAAVMGMAAVNLSPRDFQQISRALYPLLQGGLVKPVVRRTYALRDLPDAHAAVIETGAAGNLVIDMSL